VHSTRQDIALPDEVAQTIVAKAEGNPFFLEELTRAVIEQGDSETTVEVPDTIQGVLSARIDRLPETHKRLLQTASVLGRKFSSRLLETIWEGSGSLDALLLELKQMEFLFERTAAEESLYVFKHALTQEVAYESLLTTRRQRVHAATGHALERLYHNGLAEHYEELAHHFTRGEVWEKAFDYLAKSGDKARQAFANHEAIALYTQAIEVSERMTPAPDAAQLLPVYEGRGLVWKFLNKYDEAIADFQMMHQMARTSGNQRQEGESLFRLADVHHQKMTDEHRLLEERYAREAIQLARQTGDQKILAMSLDALGRVHQARGDLQEADRLVGMALQISQQEGYQDTLVSALRSLGMHAYWQGHFQRVLHLGQEWLTLSRDIHDGSLELVGLSTLCLALWSLGNYAQACLILHEGMTKAQDRESMRHIGRLTNTQGWFHREFGDLSSAVEYDQESMELGQSHHIANVEVSALINLGLDYLALRQYERASSYLVPTLDRVQREAFGVHRWRWTIRLLIGLADLAYTTSDYDQALRYVEEGLKEAQRTSSQKYIALGWSLRGKIITKLGDTDTAGTEFQRAFTLADQLQSPSLIYPIAYDLGQWHESTGNEREASALYGKAKATIEQMATAVEDEALRSTFLQSALVQKIRERATRLGG
jgi:tetratricopeptide (TPR) repeat protein